MAQNYSTTNLNLNTQRANRRDIEPVASHDLAPTSSSTNGLLQASTNIIIFSQDSLVGMIQSFTINENRTIDKLQAIGYEGVVQAVPQNTNGGTLNVSRIALYESNMWNALGLTYNGLAYNPIGGRVAGASNTPDALLKTSGGDSNKLSTGHKRGTGVIFKTLRDQRFPFEIKVKTRTMGSSTGENSYYVETYIDCWLQNYGKSYTVNQITVAENATISYADVY